jgi:translocation and assembly module TamA
MLPLSFAQLLLPVLIEAFDGFHRAARTGDAPAELVDLLRRTSLLNALRDKPPLSLGRLRVRADEDVKRIRKALRSEGYYAGDVSYRIGAEGDRTKVEIQVSTGPRYHVSRSEVQYIGAPDVAGDLPGDLTEFGLIANAPARAAEVVAAEAKLVAALKNRSRPFVKASGRRLTVDHRTRSMTVVIDVDAGPFAHFGPVSFDGSTGVDERYLLGFVPWAPGDPFTQEKVDRLAAKLRGTGLFASVKVETAAQLDASGRLPVKASVTEGRHRSIGLGAAYSTGEGVSAEAFWEHRNLFGRAERLRGTVTGGRIRQEVGLDFKIPNFRRLDQDIVSDTRFTRQDTDAFEEIGVTESLRLERQLSPRWRVGSGGSLDFSEIDDGEATRRFALLGVPTFAYRDNRDDLLNPSRGATLRFDVIPYKTFIDQSASFLRSELMGTVYRALTEDARVIVAARARFGSIIGSETDEIPATKRFFAGGGGSIRGFQFQLVGPLDEAGEPLGGRSRVEAGLEARFRVYGPFGLVTFVEGGNVFDNALPDFSDPFRVGAGVGLRYFTPIGPLRFDVAFPVNRRRGIDDAFQIYLSIGQSF